MDKMTSKQEATITTNEDYVRMRVYDGELPASKATQKLLRMERSQRGAERKHYQRVIDSLLEINRALCDENDDLRDRLGLGDDA